MERLARICSASPTVAAFAVTREGVTWARLRITLTDTTFVDVFYNEVSGKTAYAWIRDESRILGADNTGGWHWHPFEQPETHQPVEAEVTFEEFVSEVETHLTS
jgi:hypothetical protein